MIRLLDSDQWEEIFDSLTRNKARTFLTAFGIFWGVFMLILLMGGGKGLETMLSSNFAGSASNSGFMISNQTTVAYHGFSKGRYWNIKLQDAASLKNNIPEIDIATPTVRYWGASAKYNNKSSRVGLIGEYTDYAVVDNPRIIKGRASPMVFSSEECRERSPFCAVRREMTVKIRQTHRPCLNFMQARGR